MAEGSETSSDVVRIQDHGIVRVVSMNRPDKLNALNTTLLVALRDALQDADQDDRVRALVLTGEGRGFSAGADLSEFRGEQTPETVKRNALRSSLMSGLQVMLRTLSKPWSPPCKVLRSAAGPRSRSAATWWWSAPI